jgi:hypothetical protein
MKFERTFIKDLENYIDSQESVLQLLRKKLLNFKVEHSEAVDNPEVYFANELNKFLLLKRLASDVELLSDKTFDVASKFKSKVNLYKRENLLPSKNDLMVSALSIARLQKSQGLKTDKLAKGIFGGIKRRWVQIVQSFKLESFKDYSTELSERREKKKFASCFFSPPKCAP